MTVVHILIGMFVRKAERVIGECQPSVDSHKSSSCLIHPESHQNVQ